MVDADAVQSAPEVTASAGHALAVRLCALFLLALGITTLVGWARGMPQLVQVRPEWTPMVVNTAIGFVLCGAGLLAALAPGRLARHATLLIGVSIAVLGLEEWGVLAFDLSPAFSQPELHRPLQPDYPHPGRMAPNSALCFLLAGSGLAALAWRAAATTGTWVRRAGMAVLAVGSLGVIGYSLRLEFLYGWTGVVRMAVHTGVGMIVLGTGLWNLVRARVAALPASDGEEVAGVQRTSTLLLVLFGASAGIGAVAFLQDEVREQARSELVNMSRANNLLFSQIIEHRSVRAAVAGNERQIAPRLRALAGNPNPAPQLAELRAWAASLLPYGVSSVDVQAGGRSWHLAGRPARAAMRARLAGKFPGALLWDGGYVLQRTLPVRDASGAIGTLRIEQPLDVLNQLNRGFGDTGEVAVCSRVADRIHCFPSRNRPRPFSIGLDIAGQPLPMARALSGQRGSTIALDYRKVRVLAAYAPIGDTSLGLVVKRDVADVYMPIRQQFQRTALLLAGLLALGMWIVRWRLRPLLHALESSRAEARGSSARFEAAVESNLDAFFILEPVRDAHGDVADLRYALLNARAERMFGCPRGDVIGRLMCELFPERRDDGTLARYLRVIETGEPLVEEVSGTDAAGAPQWSHVQAVRLGSGLGITVRDITLARQASEQAQHQAIHDPLTGLANRAGFARALDAAILDARTHGHAFALALLDLDEFKPINDSLGHLVGDQVLQRVAARLVDVVRATDCIARLGGDEFVLVLPHLDYPADAEAIARKLVTQLAMPMRVEGHDLMVTASIGLSTYPHDGTDATALLKAADAAMYRAKRAGRNRYALHVAGGAGGDSMGDGAP